MAITSPNPLQAEMEGALDASQCPLAFGGVLAGPFSRTLPSFYGVPLHHPVVSSGTCFLSPTACAGLKCLVLLILTHHKLPPVISAWLLLSLNSWLRDALQP